MNTRTYSGTLFLMQSFWNHLARQWGPRRFMQSWEFQSYLIWGTLSIVIFPVLQWWFRDDNLMTEVAPQMAFAAELFIVFLLGLRSDRKLKSLLPAARKGNKARETVLRLKY